MNEEIKKLILGYIDEVHQKDILRNIGPNRDRLAADLLSKRKYELRHGKVTNQHGVLQDLKHDVELLIDASSYIGRKSSAVDDAKFISKYKRPTSEARKKLADEVELVFKKLSKINCIVPADQENYDRAIWHLSKNFLYEISPEGDVVFAKFNESGLIGESRYTFDELMHGVAHLIDRDRTRFAFGLKENKQKAMAAEFFDTKPRKEELMEKIKVIRKNEIISEIPSRRLPQIPRAEIERETMRRECAVRGFGDLDKVITGGGMPLATIQRTAKLEYDDLSDVSGIKYALQKIQPNGPKTWNDISYE